MRRPSTRITGAAESSDPAGYPYGIYTIPQISFIGKTEEQLTDEDVPYEVGVAYYREIARGQITGHVDGRLKLLFHRETLELLGVHIVGPRATELIAEACAGLELEATSESIGRTMHAHPTLSEALMEAGEDAGGHSIQMEVAEP